jgi:hypothetical protein
MSKHQGLLTATGVTAGLLAVVLIACGETDSPTAVASSENPSASVGHSAAGHVQKGYIGGWLNGRAVRLRYSKPFFCAAPPASGAATKCEIGAEAEVFPRRGRIPKVYAIVPAGFSPDPSTLHCFSHTLCLNHPPTIDASRIAGPGATSVPPSPHSHIITERGGGWWNTVNIRVFDVGVWNQIAAAKSLAKVRELQADPAVGGAGLISKGTPTNIFFFFEVHKSRKHRR